MTKAEELLKAQGYYRNEAEKKETGIEEYCYTKTFGEGSVQTFRFEKDTSKTANVVIEHSSDEMYSLKYREIMAIRDRLEELVNS